MGPVNAKEVIYQCIENSDERKLVFILKQHPELLNTPLTDDCLSTALTRSVWRNDIKLVKLLLGMGCQVNYSGPKGITPLMQASKRGHLEMAKLLIENGADLLEKSNDKEAFTALDMAIIMGQYELSLYLLSLDLGQLEKLHKPEEYLEGAKGKYHSYCNYELFLDHLKARIPQDTCPNFYMRPPKPALVDPVIDRRETWSEFIKRNIEFEDPPMVERSELPADLQPQNSLLGKMRSYINGQTPYQATQITENSNNVIKDQQKIELQNGFLESKAEEQENKNSNEASGFPLTNEMKAAQQQFRELTI